MLWIGQAIVVAFGLWLVGLAAAIVVVPERATRFLLGFASSARANYTEQVLRFIAGVAFVVAAPEMRFAGGFELFGWLLAATAIGLMIMPWRWHRRFGEWTIPVALRYSKLYALSAFALGAFILYSVV